MHGNQRSHITRLIVTLPLFIRLHRPNTAVLNAVGIPVEPAFFILNKNILKYFLFKGSASISSRLRGLNHFGRLT